MSERKPPCPVRGCERRLGVGMLMCQAHWRTVPLDLRQVLWGYWADMRELLATPSEARGYLVKCAALRATFAAALAYANGDWRQPR